MQIKLIRISFKGGSKRFPQFFSRTRRIIPSDGFCRKIRNVESHFGHRTRKTREIFNDRFAYPLRRDIGDIKCEKKKLEGEEKKYTHIYIYMHD